MVSVNPTPAQGFYFFDPMNMGLSGLNSGPPPPPTANPGPVPAMGNNAVEDPSKKIRKPYTITKSRESWTEQEHDKFLEALQLFDRDWKKIEAFVGSKTVIQIRSHAQKYFLKVQKNGTSEHVPPPRPKRKATHPYPQKAPKGVPVASQVNVLFQPSSTLFESGFAVRPDVSPALGNQIANAAFSSWSYNSMPAITVSEANKDEAHAFGPVAPSNCCQSSSNESTPKSWANTRVLDRVSRQSARVMPDFARVYKFIGSVFDPNESGHLQVLKQMDPINLETVLLLMRNLCVNLTSPEFEEQRRLLASYNGDSDGLKSGDPFSLCAEKSGSAILSA